MTKNVILWVLALVITLASALFQRMTGPTYPITGNLTIGGRSVEYRLHRSQGGDDDHKVSIRIPDQSLEGVLSYKRFKTEDPWIDLPMRQEGEYLVGYLPHQPPAGKLQYHVKLIHEGDEVALPQTGSVVIRFKGAVPAWALVPHIILMFVAMVVSTRAGLQAIVTGEGLKRYTLWSIALVFVGGLVFGPMVQKYAFGELWTGVPLGIDLTDNKTLIAFLGWLVATIAVLKGKSPRAFVLGASILMLAIFLIPHSVLGSELDYSEMEAAKISLSVISRGNFPN
jgi:hypothetical protein